MAEKVGIVAVAQTKFDQKREEHLTETLVKVVRDVMKQTGLEFKPDGTGIDSTVVASQDYFGGPAGIHMYYAYTVGAYKRPDERVELDGAFAVAYGAMQILSGHHDVVLVVGHNRESACSKNQVENLGLDHIYGRKIGLDFVAAAGMQAMRYLNKYKITSEQCAKVVVKNRTNGKNNPFVMHANGVTVKDVLNSEMLADPIRAMEAKPVPVDGAVAMILACEKKAKKLTDKPVWIRGMGMCYDQHELGYRDLADCKALVSAAQMAYKMAGIKDPVKELDVAEISEHYSYQELLWSEGLGLCGKGEGGKLIDKGTTSMGGQLPVNPSGGLLSGVPLCVAGMQRVAECVLQLRGEAKGRQVSGAKTALAHGVEGPAGQLHCVIILQR
jgi:acetyl-CoA C-acetyltransferase